MARLYTIKVAELTRLQELRGWTVEALASAAGIHAKTIHKWISGTEAFIKKVKMVAKALDVSIDDIAVISEGTSADAKPGRNQKWTTGPTEQDQAPDSTYLAHLSQDDADDPILENIFFETFKEAKKTYKRIRAVHKILNKYEILSPKDAMLHFQHIIQDTKFKWVNLYEYHMEGGNNEFFFVVVYSNQPPTEPRSMDYFYRDDSSIHSLSLINSLVVYHCVGKPPQDAVDLIGKFYGVFHEQHLIVRTRQGDVIPFDDLTGDDVHHLTFSKAVSGEDQKPNDSEGRFTLPPKSSMNYDFKTKKMVLNPKRKRPKL